MRSTITFIFLICLPILSFAQAVQEMDALPYREIPAYPESFDATNVAARMIDGLGFRYYWATESLRKEDLSYRPDETARTSQETLEHIYGLSKMIHNAVMQQPNIRSSEAEKMSFEEQRRATLLLLEEASKKLKTSQPDKMEDMEIIFQRGETTSTFPFWNIINGPLADALWHVGQVVSFRRASGNPINPKISVFTGTVRD